MITAIVFVCGNDGSGKSTFTRRFAAKVRAHGLTAVIRPYYHSSVRRALRAVVERAVGANEKKKQPLSLDNVAQENRHMSRRRDMRAKLIGTILWMYQSCMAAEWWARCLLCRADVLVVDRCFVDDLVSTFETLQTEPDEALLRTSCRLFPMRWIYYLSAGNEVEFARITTVDLSPQLHRIKGQRYQQFIALLEQIGAPVKRIDSAPRDSHGTP